jgi:hypothetical protein
MLCPKKPDPEGICGDPDCASPKKERGNRASILAQGFINWLFIYLTTKGNGPKVNGNAHSPQHRFRQSEGRYGNRNKK